MGKFYNEALSTTIFTVKLTAGPLVLWPLLYECIAIWANFSEEIFPV